MRTFTISGVTAGAELPKNSFVAFTISPEAFFQNDTSSHSSTSSVRNLLFHLTVPEILLSQLSEKLGEGALIAGKRQQPKIVAG